MTKKAIGLAEYNKMAQDEQFDLLHRDGVYIGKRNTGKLTVVLFQLNGFYVEVYYKEYRKQVDHILCSDNADVLHPYIDQVQVRDLSDNGEK